MSATITFEVECEVSGQVRSAEPDVGIMSNYTEDVCVESLSALVHSRVNGVSTWKNVNLLEGLDNAARAIVLSNIGFIYQTEADEAVMAEYE